MGVLFNRSHQQPQAADKKSKSSLYLPFINSSTPSPTHHPSTPSLPSVCYSYAREVSPENTNSYLFSPFLDEQEKNRSKMNHQFNSVLYNFCLTVSWLHVTSKLLSRLWFRPSARLSVQVPVFSSIVLHYTCKQNTEAQWLLCSFSLLTETSFSVSMKNKASGTAADRALWGVVTASITAAIINTTSGWITTERQQRNNQLLTAALTNIQWIDWQTEWKKERRNEWLNLPVHVRPSSRSEYLSWQLQIGPSGRSVHRCWHPPLPLIHDAFNEKQANDRRLLPESHQRNRTPKPSKIAAQLHEDNRKTE